MADPSTTTARQGVREAPPAGPRTLDDLARLAPQDLALLYRAAKTPRVEDLEGPLAGRMLAIPSVHSTPILRAALRTYAGSAVFPWQGKTFRTLGEGRGEGLNRVLGNRFSWFRFTTAVKRSRAGDFDSVELDYDHPGNPYAIRIVKDEVREVAPGLWLGLAWLKFLGRYRLWLYFGLAKK
jgi:hypothetical protein